MTITQLKNIQIPDYLTQKGFTKKNGTLWEHPYRSDKNSSFSVFINDKNKSYTFKDHSSGETGNIVDLMLKVENTDLSTILKRNSFFFSEATKFPTEELTLTNQNELLSVEKIKTKNLFAYAHNRGISKPILTTFCKEVKYRNQKGTFYGLAIENCSKGFEINIGLKNGSFKTNVGKKDITLLKGIDSEKVSIFESFFDFLSFQQYLKRKDLKNDVIILNSLSLYNSDILKKYTEVYLFLDNDKPADTTIEKIKTLDKKIMDCRYIYADYKDFNEYLLAKK